MVNRVLHIFAVIGMFAFSSCGSGDSSNSAESTPTPAIDCSITAEKIRGNVQKYIGTRVAFYCKIDNVIEGGAANATCGPRVALVGEPAQPRDIMNVTAMQKWTDELSTWTGSQSHVALLVLVGNRVSSLDAGDLIRVTGTVDTTNGTNGMGVKQSFPAVDVDSVQQASGS